MLILCQKEYFKSMTLNRLDEWLGNNREQLIGSAIFTQNKSMTSKVVSWAEHFKCTDKKFCPSHTGSIIWYENDLYMFNMKPLRASVIKLKDYLSKTEDDFKLILRNFDLDTKMFSLNIAEHIGEFYPFMSAIRSVGTKKQSKWRTHCSELHLRELQKQGLFKGVNAEITPDELLHLMIGQEEA